MSRSARLDSFSANAPFARSACPPFTFTRLTIARLTIACLTIACLTLGGGAAAWAQPEGLSQEGASAEAFMTADRELLKLLRQAESEIKSKQYVDAVGKLGALLNPASAAPQERVEVEDYFLTVDGKRTTLREQTLRLLAESPPEVREAYELRFGVEAKAKLREALLRGDDDLLAEVSRHYFHTEAGLEATWLLGRGRLNQNRPLSAVLCLRRLAETPRGRAKYDPELTVLIAAGWHFAGLTDEAEQTLFDLKLRQPKAVLMAGGQKTPLFTRIPEALGWLEGLVGQRVETPRSAEAEWRLFRGTPARDGLADVQTPLREPRWRASLALGKDDDKHLGELVKQAEDQNRAPLPSLHPVASGDWVFARSVSGAVLGVHFPTGKRVWQYPRPPISGHDDAGRDSNQAQQTDARRAQLAQRLWEDGPHGQLSTDGQHVYMLDRLGHAAPNAFAQIQILQGGVMRPNPQFPTTHNVLAALSIARQGAPVWVVGGEHGEDEPEFAGAFFLGPPLPLDGVLYAIYEKDGLVRLAAMDPRTGQRLWQQQLARVDDDTIDKDMERRLSGCSPSAAQGVLVCPTGVGALVAVDIDTRALLWGQTYLRRPDRAPQRFWTNRVQQRTPGSNWLDTSLTIVGGRVLAPLSEVGELRAFDLLTGEETWSEPRARGDSLFVACAQGSSALLVGKTGLVAVDLEQGQDQWKLEFGARPTGRGLCAGKHYFQPVSSGELLKIDLATGQIAARLPTAEPLGNLLAHREELVSQGPRELWTLPQVEPLRKRVSRALGVDPGNAAALLGQAELSLHDGKFDEALRTLRAAHAAGSSPAIRERLAKLLLKALADDFAAHQSAATDFAELFREPRFRVEYYRVLAAGWERQGQFERAFATYMDWAAEEEALGGNGAAHRLEEIEPDWRVRRERWFHARLADLWEQASPSQRGLIESAVTRRLETLLARGDLAPLERFLDYFGALPAAAPARLRIAELHLRYNDLLKAHWRLLELEQSGTAPAEATALHAEVLARAGWHALAADYYRRARDAWPDAIVRPGKTGRQFADGAPPAVRRLLEGPAIGWADGRVVVSEESSSEVLGTEHAREFRVASRDDALWNGDWRFVVNHARATISASRDDGQAPRDCALRAAGERYNVGNLALSFVQPRGLLLATCFGADIAMVDALQPPVDDEDASRVLWRLELEAPGPPSPYGNPASRVQTKGADGAGFWAAPRVYAVAPANRNTGQSERLVGPLGPLTTHGVFVLRQRELQCLDPFTGETLWSRVNMPPEAVVFGDDELLFVAPPQADRARVYRARDGRPLGERPAPTFAERWATHGRRALAWRQVNGKHQLELRDLWTGEALWSDRFAGGAKACLVESDEVAVYEPGAHQATPGRLVVVSLRDGSIRVRAELAPEVPSQVASLYVSRDAERYFVAVNRPIVANPSNQVLSPGNALLNGRLYAFSRATGRPCWPAPVLIEGYGHPASQSANSPALLFVRLQQRMIRSGARPVVSALCLDRRDGATLLDTGELNGGALQFSLKPALDRQMVELQVLQKLYKIRFTDEDAPPEPPRFNQHAAAAPRDDALPRDDDLGPGDPFGKDPFGVGRDPFAPILEGVPLIDPALPANEEELRKLFRK